jgi:fermentation-respiration switch protein FrsA (DUF1100 family)
VIRKRQLARAAGVVAVVAVLVVVGILSLQRFFTFPRHALRGREAPPPSVEVLWIDTPEGRVEGWFLPATQAGPRPVVVFAHGNGELIDDWPASLAPYRAMGVSVLLVEYRGYGRSAGSPSEDAITEDFVAFHDLVAARPDVDAARFVYHGRSMGGGAVCALAARRPPAALVLQSTFTSLAAVMRRFGIPRLLVLDPFDNVAVLGALSSPVLVIHGTSDALIPPDHARALAAAAAQGTLVWFEGGHNDPPAHDAYWAAIRGLLVDSGVL